MENYDLEIKRIKRNNYIVFGIFTALVLAVIVVGIVYQYQHSFSTAKWERNPEERTKIVNDLLEDYEIVGMQKADVVELLHVTPPQAYRALARLANENKLALNGNGAGAKYLLVEK